MLKRLRESERGNAMIEFALLLPVYMILCRRVFSGRAALVREKLRNVARVVLGKPRRLAAGNIPAPALLAGTLYPPYHGGLFDFNLNENEGKT